MGAPKPIHGYPSRTAAVLALREEGLAQRDISARLGLDISAVSALIASGTKTQKYRNERLPQREGRYVIFPSAVLARLRPNAEAREISINELVRRIIAVVGKDGLVDGILDDADEIAAREATRDEMED